MKPQNEDSYSDSGENLKKPTIQNQRAMNLQLALNQANEELRDANAQRRIADTKIYAILTITLTFVGFLISSRPWVSLGSVGQVFLALALGLYSGVIAVGIISYYPRTVVATKARAIMNELDRPYGVLASWTVEGLLSFAEDNYRVACEKGFWVRCALILLIIATALLAASLVIR